MKKTLIAIIAVAATLCVAETLQSIPVASGSSSASWTNSGSRVYLDRIIYTMSEATTTNETLTFTVSYITTGSLASNESAVVVSLPKKVLVDVDSVITVERTAATTNTTGNTALVFE